MLISQPTALARLVGASLAIASTTFLFRDCVLALGSSPPSSGIFPLSLPACGLALYFGEWLWSLEGGWDRLKRLNRIVFFGTAGGTLGTMLVTGLIVRAAG